VPEEQAWSRRVPPCHCWSVFVNFLGVTANSLFLPSESLSHKSKSMRRNAVKVCVRTRPTHQFAQDNIHIYDDQNVIQITQNQEEDVGGLQNNRQNSFKFKLDHIFHNASQALIYDMFARDTVQGVVDGINGAILTYGQTGSGKTFTMVRPSLF
jgi:Tfp pilus assembly pilus retraction ATPase PilT